MRFTLTIVRHGETDQNKARVLQGQIDTDLNKLGIEQAKLAGKALAAEKFDLVYASDLKRAFWTCRYIVEANESFNDVDKIQKEPRLRERSFGIMENKPVTEYMEMAKANNIKNSFRDFTPEGGETEEYVRQRGREFFQDLLRIIAKSEATDRPVGKVLLVSHGGFIRELLSHFFDEIGCDPAENFGPGAHKGISPNTSWSKFEIDFQETDGKMKVSKIVCNDLMNKDHLRELNNIAL